MNENPQKIVFIGDTECNKTKILVNYVTNEVNNDYTPVSFENTNKTINFHDHTVQLSLWDTSGQEDYEKLRPLSYPGTDLFILFFSLTKKTSYDNSFYLWVPEIWRNTGNTPIIFVGLNKSIRDADPENSNYILDSDAMKACEPFSLLYHNIDPNDINTINDLFNTIIPEALFNKSLDEKKKKIKKNVNRYLEHHMSISKKNEKIEKLKKENIDKKDENVEKEIEKLTQLIHDEETNFFKEFLLTWFH